MRQWTYSHYTVCLPVIYIIDFIGDSCHWITSQQHAHVAKCNISSRVTEKNGHKVLSFIHELRHITEQLDKPISYSNRTATRRACFYFLPINKSTALKTFSTPAIRGIAEKTVMLWEIGATVWNKKGTLTYNQRRDMYVSDVLPAHCLHLPNDHSPYNLRILGIPCLQYGVFST